MKTIGTCKDCKWSNDDGSGCKHSALDGAWDRQLETTQVFAYSDSYPLSTSPDFGCIHWDAKAGFNPDISKESPEMRWIIFRPCVCDDISKGCQCGAVSGRFITVGKTK